MNKLFFLTGLLVVWILCGCNKDDTPPLPDIGMPEVVDQYRFSIVPGSGKWENLSQEERLNAAQLPADVLKTISTKGLIRAFLETAISLNTSEFYPIETYRKIQEMYPSFNSVQELFSRNDAGKSLLEYYEAINYDCLAAKTQKEHEYFSIRIAALAVLFTQPEILEQLNEADRQKTVNLLLNANREMKKLYYYDGITDFVSGRVMMHIMNHLLQDKISYDTEGLIITPSDCFPDVADKYIYTIIPGPGPDAYQIPEEELKKISTLGLIRSFLDYPSLDARYGIFSIINDVSIFSRMFQNHNCALELISRNDASKELLKYYHATCLDCVETLIDGVGTLAFNVQIRAVPVFLTQQNVSNQMTHADRKKAVALLLNKCEQILSSWIRDPNTAAEVMLDIMRKDNYQPAVDFGDHYSYFSNINNIIPLVINYLNNY